MASPPVLLRFGPHAISLVGNGWRSIVPARGKVPRVNGWQMFAAHPPHQRHGGCEDGEIIDALAATYRANHAR
jgi:hypothetical protein